MTDELKELFLTIVDQKYALFKKTIILHRNSI